MKYIQTVNITNYNNGKLMINDSGDYTVKAFKLFGNQYISQMNRIKPRYKKYSFDNTQWYSKKCSIFTKINMILSGNYIKGTCSKKTRELGI